MSDPRESAWRQALAARVSLGLCITSALAGVGLWLLVNEPVTRMRMVVVSFTFAAVLAGLIWRSPTRAAPPWVLIGGLLVLSFVGVTFVGPMAGPALALAVTTIVAGLSLGRRGFAIVLALEVVGVAVAGWAMATGRIPTPIASDVAFDSPRVWLRSFSVSGLFLTVCVVLVRGAVARLEDAVARTRTEMARRELAERERQVAQDAVLAAQKLEAVAQVAAGIAHDFNNLLAIVGGKTALAMRRLPADSPERAELEVVADVVKRGAGLTRQLLLFGRRQVARPEVIEPDARLRTLERLVRTMVGDGIEVTWRLAAPDRAIEIEPSQLDQIVFNLVLNARDAIGPRGGAIEVATAADDTAVVLSVKDDGCGMDSATLARAFDPLFTTKPVGEGTGLGLATVQTIARLVGGEATLASEPGRGTRVAVRFPARVPAPVAAGPASAPAAAGAAVVLLVDDEPYLRRSFESLLREAGFEVHVAADGAEALAIVAGLGRLDAVVSDVSMTGLSGDELVSQLRAQRPGLPALLVSGYVKTELDLPRLGDPPVRFMAKPFDPDQLIVSLRGLIAG